MKEFTVAGVQMAVIPNDVDANIKKALQWIPKAVDTGAELIVFPETITTGFTPCCSKEELWDMIDTIPGKVTDEIQKAAVKYNKYIVWPTYERGKKRGEVYNSAALIGRNGDIIGVYSKTHPWPGERVDCGNWVTPGMHADAYDTDLGKIGIVICYDGDFPNLSTTIALKGAEMIIRPSAFLRTYDHWWGTNFARAYDNHVYIVAVNAVGTDASSAYYFGHSMIIGPNGWKYAQARCSEDIIYAKINDQGFKNVYGGIMSPQSFDHMEDRNLAVYDVLKEGKSSFEPSIRIPRIVK